MTDKDSVRLLIAILKASRLQFYGLTECYKQKKNALQMQILENDIRAIRG